MQLKLSTTPLFLQNDVGQLRRLVDYFDFAINEDMYLGFKVPKCFHSGPGDVTYAVETYVLCFHHALIQCHQYNECGGYNRFTQQNKVLCSHAAWCIVSATVGSMLPFLHLFNAASITTLCAIHIRSCKGRILVCLAVPCMECMRHASSSLRVTPLLRSRHQAVLGTEYKVTQAQADRICADASARHWSTLYQREHLWIACPVSMLFSWPHLMLINLV